MSHLQEEKLTRQTKRYTLECYTSRVCLASGIFQEDMKLLKLRSSV